MMGLRCAALCGVFFAVAVGAAEPTFIFAGPPIDGGAPAPSLSPVIEAWTTLPDALKDQSYLAAPVRISDVPSRASVVEFLQGLENASISVMAHLDMRDPGQDWDPAHVDAILGEGNAAGILVTGLDFNVYSSRSGPPDIVAPAAARWLQEAIRICAARSKPCVVVLEGIDCARIMSQTNYRALFETIRAHADTFVPCVTVADVQAPGNLSAALGMWVEGSVDAWGASCSVNALTGAAYFRGTSNGDNAHEGLAAAAMAFAAWHGASVFYFNDRDALWQGPNDVWEKRIAPIVDPIARGRMIPDREAAAESLPIVYQLNVAPDAETFHLILRDLDPVIAEGHMIRAAYAAEAPEVYPDFIPNRAPWQAVPALSPYADTDAMSDVRTVVRPGQLAGVAEWNQVIAAQTGTQVSNEYAFRMTANGHDLVINSDESTEHPLPAVGEWAVAVAGIAARRESDGVRISWQARLDVFSYTVWRRALPDGVFEIIERNVEGSGFFDAMPPEEIAYAVTAVGGPVARGRVMIAPGGVRIIEPGTSTWAEEVVMRAGEAAGIVRPVGGADSSTAAVAAPGGVSRAIESLAVAVERRDLESAMRHFSDRYADPQGWDVGYVRRTLQLFFERYRHTRLTVDVRRVTENENTIDVFAYVHFHGAGIENGIAAHDGVLRMPGTADGTSWIRFENEGGAWRIATSNPAIVNMRDLTRDAAALPGPDRYEPGL